MGLKGDDLGREEGWWALKVILGKGGGVVGIKCGNLGREEGWWALKVGTWEGRRGDGA